MIAEVKGDWERLKSGAGWIELREIKSFNESALNST